jgi:hypothetical protein
VSNAAVVEGLVPFVHVRDVGRSAAFYALFGFEVRNTYDDEHGHRVWCWLECRQARLMLAQADTPVVASQQAVLFYAYAHELEELHRRVAAAGHGPGPIEPGAPGPDRQFGVSDPDGYLVMVTDADALATGPASEDRA